MASTRAGVAVSLVVALAFGPTAAHAAVPGFGGNPRVVVQPGGSVMRASRVGPPSSPSLAGTGRWRAPVAPLRILAPFDPPEYPWLAGHRGIDLGTSLRQTVSAAGAGRVAFVGLVAGRAVVSIDHRGLRTTYEPVDSDLVAGDRVETGDPIGTIGSGTGHCGSGRCLHLGLRRGREYLNPLLLLRPTSARLRPW